MAGKADGDPQEAAVGGAAPSSSSSSSSRKKKKKKKPEGGEQQAPGLFSCFGCREHKVFCDKVHPCGRWVRQEAGRPVIKGRGGV